MKRKIIAIILLLIIVLLAGCQQRIKQETGKVATVEKTGLEGDLSSLNETDLGFEDLNNLDSELNEIQGLDV